MTGRNKWIAGELPARASPRGRLPSRPSGALVDRLVRANKKNLVGRPLATALRSKTIKRRWRTGALAATGICIGLGGLPLLVAGLWLEGVALSAVGGAALVLAVVILSNIRFVPAVQAKLGTELQRDAEAFDAYLAGISPRLPPAALSCLARIKETLACVLSALAQGEGKAADLSAEDFFFAREMLSRYVPDACRHYVEAVGLANSPVAPGSGQSADDSLVRQLDILHVRLEKLLAGIAAARLEKLASHEAFIESKR